MKTELENGGEKMDYRKNFGEKSGIQLRNKSKQEYGYGKSLFHPQTAALPLIKVAIALLVLMFTFASAYAVENLIALQGNVENNGLPVQYGNITVTIYTQASGGSLVYDSAHDYDDIISNGRFDIMLGDGSQELSLDYGKIYYMGIAVNGQALDFNGSSRRMFQSNVGSINGTFIMAGSLDKSTIASEGTWAQSEIPSLTGQWSGSLNASKIIAQNLLNVNSSTYALYLGGFDADVFLRNDTSLSSRINLLSAGSGAAGNCSSGEYAQNITPNGVECRVPEVQNPFNQTLNTTSNVIFNNISANNISANKLSGSLNWSYLTSIPSYILDYTSNLTDRLNKSDQRYNETLRVDELNITRAMAGNCSAGQYAQNITALGVVCSVPPPANPFNQNLNTSDNVTFYNITAINISAENLFGSLDWSYLTGIPGYVSDYTTNISDRLNQSDQRYNESLRLDDMNNTKAATAICSDGTYVVNTTSTGTQCAAPAAAGSADQIQYKAASGNLGGMAYAKADSSGYLTMPNATDPATPSTGVTIYASDRGDESILAYEGIQGAAIYPGPAIWSQDIGWCQPSHSGTGATALACMGLTQTAAVGTVINPAPTSTTFQSQMTRTTANSTTTANSGAEFKGAQLNWWRGNAADRGGFKFVWRGSWSNRTALSRGCVGMFGTTAAISVANAINASTNAVYAGFDSTQTALQICSNDAAGTATCVSCGANFPVGNTVAAMQAVYEVTIFTKPNSAQYTVYVRRLDSAVADCNATISANIPANTQFLTWHVFCNNGGGTDACAIDVNKIYLEKNY